MKKSRNKPRSFLANHALSLVTAVILSTWIVLYCYAAPETHWGSFLGNAIADWTGVLMTVVATKYFYEIGSTESRQPKTGNPNSLLTVLRNHSLTIFLVITGAAWVAVFRRMNPQAKWGQVVSNLVSEWTQLLGLVLLTKRLIEQRSKESK